MLAADQLVAVTNSVRFRYDDGKTFLHWETGENVHPAVWISLFLFLVTMINMLPVKVWAIMISYCIIVIQLLTGLIVLWRVGVSIRQYKTQLHHYDHRHDGCAGYYATFVKPHTSLMHHLS